jgi:hypothetical protein
MRTIRFRGYHGLLNNANEGLFDVCSMCGAKNSNGSVLIVTSDVRHTYRQEEPNALIGNVTIVVPDRECNFEKTALCIPASTDSSYITPDTLKGSVVISSICMACKKVVEISLSMEDITTNISSGLYRIVRIA